MTQHSQAPAAPVRRAAPRRPRLRWLVPALVALAIGSAVVVGRAATGSPPDFTIDGDTSALLQPGGSPQPIDLAFSNPNSVSLSLSSLTVSVASVTAPNATPGLPCTAADYAVTQFSGVYPFKIPAGASTLQSSGARQATWPTIGMVDSHADQDGCKDATVNLSYAGDAFNDDPATAPAPAASAPTPTAPAMTTTSTAPATTAPLTPPAGTPGIALAILPVEQGIVPGGKVTFSITVRNSGTTGLIGVTVKNPAAPDCTRTIGALAAGAVRQFTCAQPNVSKSFVDLATATGRAPGGTTVTASARAQVDVGTFIPPAHSAVGITTLPASQRSITRIVTHRSRHGSTTSVSYGGAAFRIKVTNRGNVTLTGVRVADRLVPDCSRTLGRLAPGAALTYRCVTVAVRRSFTSTAIATGRAAKATVSARSRSEVHVRIERSAVGRATPPGSGKPKVDVVLTIPDVLFEFNKSGLRPQETHILAAIVDTLNTRYPGLHLTVTGYTDSVGTVAYNLDLSRRRATAVADWLAQHGIRRDLIAIAWKGEGDPIATNATDAGRQQNRRVTITVRTVRP